MIGREAPAPKLDADTPNSCDSVSPSELPSLLRNSSPASTLAGVRIWVFSSAANGLAVTTISCNGDEVVCATADMEASADKTALASKVGWTYMEFLD